MATDAMTARGGVAVIILTFNEEANLAQALQSVTGWAEQIFVLDSISTDATVDIARSFRLPYDPTSVRELRQAAQLRARHLACHQ